MIFIVGHLILLNAQGMAKGKLPIRFILIVLSVVFRKNY